MREKDRRSVEMIRKSKALGLLRKVPTQVGAELECGKTEWGKRVRQREKQERQCAGGKRRAVPGVELVQQGPGRTPRLKR